MGAAASQGAHNTDHVAHSLQDVFWVKQELYYWSLAVFIDSVALLEAEVLWIREAFQHSLFMLEHTCLNNVIGVFGLNPSAEILERFFVPYVLRYITVRIILVQATECLYTLLLPPLFRC